MAVVLGFIVLVPVLVVGTWFVVMTVILGLADGILWVLDQGWKKNRGGGMENRACVSRLRLEKHVEMGAEGCAPSCATWRYS